MPGIGVHLHRNQHLIDQKIKTFLIISPEIADPSKFIDYREYLGMGTYIETRDFDKTAQSSKKRSVEPELSFPVAGIAVCVVGECVFTVSSYWPEASSNQHT